MNDIQRLAFAAFTGESATKSKAECNEAIREAVREACSGEWNLYKFLDNRYKVFALISEVMKTAMVASLSGKYDRFAEFRDTSMGDKNYFEVEDNEIYPMYTSARGNADIERHKIVDKNFSVSTLMKQVKFYDEFDRFMAGKIDLARLTEKATDAFGNHVGYLISSAIYDSYSSVGTDYKATGAFDASTFATIMEHVKAANGVDALQIWGTTTALGNISDGFGYSDNAKDRANDLGYYASFRGADMFAMPQAYSPQTTTFAVGTNYAVILPVADTKIVKVVFEGDPVVLMSDGTTRNDLQPEVLYGRRVGVAALTVPAGKYGVYIFQ
jgi:hypothetical protein